jgi:hypothetical protein
MRENHHKRIARRTCTALHLSGLPVQSRLDRGPCGLTDLAGLAGKEHDEKLEEPIGFREEPIGFHPFFKCNRKRVLKSDFVTVAFLR